MLSDIMIYERLSLIVPKQIRNWINTQLGYSNLDIPVEKFTGFLVGTVSAAAVLVSAILFLLVKTNPIIVFFLSFFILLGAILFLLTNAADTEGKAVEKILPDALELIATNIKSGLTTERALIVSARPEFGALSKELKFASKSILSGERIEDALLLISTKIKSNVLDRTMWLIAEGIRNGGQIANLLIQLSNDLREENALKSEVGANISMYVMLIFFSAAFGAPALFGISSFIVGVLAEQTSNSHISTDLSQELAAKNPALGLLGNSKSSITEDFIVFFVEVTLLLTCVFASIILGIINTGNEKGGVKYFVPILVISFALFFLTRMIIASAFGGMVK
jgi:hypothetical protein